MPARWTALLTLALAVVLLATAAGAATPPREAPAQPWKDHVLKPPRLACAVDLPAGWASQRPMPDHILELWELRDGGMPLPQVTVEEGDPAKDLTQGLQQFQRRMERVWAGQVVLASKRPIQGAMDGVLLKYERPARDAQPAQTHWAALYVVDGLLVHALVYPQDARDTPQLAQVLNTLRCAPKRG